MPPTDYSFFSKILHQFALGTTSLKEIAFELDSLLAGKTAIETEKEHVFVTGLARAGTTIFLKTLYHCDDFLTLSYRDMPFVMAPYFWHKLSRHQYQQGSSKIRAHDDRIMVNFDSPEAFEEVFWLTFSEDDYVQTHHLFPYNVNDDVINKFRRYVNNILQKNSSKKRYLSKNNNNILRLNALSKAFPKSHVIILFRNPIDQATSLLRQHLHFVKIQNDDKFVLKYMNWLGHFEFGLNCKEFCFDGDCNKMEDDLTTLDHWLKLWHNTYKYILETKEENHILIDYDDLTARPEYVLKRLSSFIHIEEEKLITATKLIQPSANYTSTPLDDRLLKKTNSIYSRLKENYTTHFELAEKS